MFKECDLKRWAENTKALVYLCLECSGCWKSEKYRKCPKCDKRNREERLKKEDIRNGKERDKLGGAQNLLHLST